MATFTGTEKEFNKFVGPLIRNLVQRKTRGKKRNQVHCEGCKNQAELQAAHAHHSRLQIIKKVLARHSKNGIITCDLEEIVDKIWKEHGSDSFVFLCESCHKAFDKFHVVVRSTSAGLRIKADDYGDWVLAAGRLPEHAGVYECVDGGPPDMLNVTGHGYRNWTTRGWGNSFSSVIDAGREPLPQSVIKCPTYWRGLKKKIAFPSE